MILSLRKTYVSDRRYESQVSEDRERTGRDKRLLPTEVCLTFPIVTSQQDVTFTLES